MADDKVTWEDTSFGKAVDSHVAEIKDWPYVIVFWCHLKEQEYNELVLNNTGFAYAFLSLMRADGPDQADNYEFIYFVKMTEDMYDTYFGAMFASAFKTTHFRIYYNGDCVGAYDKKPVTPSGD